MSCRVIWNKLCYLIHIIVRHIKHTANIADCTTCRKRTKCDDLTNMVTAIFFCYIINYKLSFFITEVDIKVRHRNTFRIKKSFKNQVVFQRIYICDTHTVCTQAGRTTATAWPYRNIVTAGIVDKIINYQIIIYKSHTADDTDFIIKSFSHFWCNITISSHKSITTKLFKENLIRTAIRRSVNRQFCFAELVIKIAFIRNFHCIFASLRNV